MTLIDCLRLSAPSIMLWAEATICAYKSIEIKSEFSEIWISRIRNSSYRFQLEVFIAIIYWRFFSSFGTSLNIVYTYYDAKIVLWERFNLKWQHFIPSFNYSTSMSLKHNAHHVMLTQEQLCSQKNLKRLCENDTTKLKLGSILMAKRCAKFSLRLISILIKCIFNLATLISSLSILFF